MSKLSSFKSRPAFARTVSTLVLGAAIISTAPIVTAGDTSSGDAATSGQAHVDMTSKKVIKMSSDKDGTRTNSHYEIIENNGVTTAYEIMDDGTRVTVDPATVDIIMMDAPEAPTPPTVMGDMDVQEWITKDGENIFIMKDSRDGDARHVEKHVRILKKGDAPHADEAGTQKRIMIKSMENDHDKTHSKVYAFSTSDEVSINIDGSNADTGSVNSARVRLEAAQSVLEGMEDNDTLSSSARRNIKKAQKALIAAAKAVETE